MSLSPDLIATYKNTDYVVFTEPELILRIGEPSPRLDGLLESQGATTAAYISAANPRGKRKSDADNATAASALHQLIDTAGYPRIAGEGRDPDGRGSAEPSFLVIGMWRENAEALGRLFSQNAIVFIEQGRAPELLLLAEK